MILASWSFGHDDSLSSVTLILDKTGATVSVETSLKNFANQDAKDTIAKQIHLVVNGKPWTFVSNHVAVDKPNDRITAQARIAEPVQTFEVIERLFPNNPNSKTIAKVMKEGEVAGEAVLTGVFTSWTYGQATKYSKSKSFTEFFSLGVTHILGGLDHLLFIFGLMLARPRIKELLKVATAFTIAHSITLSLSVLNIFSMSPRIVEPLIALSIVAVAIEKFLKPNDKVWWTVGIAFFFGLLHGFGFAGALSEVDLKAGQAGIPLAAFNIGVEVVQASLILITIPILSAAMKKFPKPYVSATKVCAALIGLAGSFWFFERVASGG
jgi:hydrogenase/urease accessory protein HupE